MDLNQKLHIKLAPLNGVTISTHHRKKPKDQNRLRGGSTSLMYACQQGLTDTIVKEIRLQVNVRESRLSLQEAKKALVILKHKYLSVNYTLP